MSTRNPSAPPQSVVPVLVYDDVRAAVEWLTQVFGFSERVQISDHRAQLAFGDGAVIVADATHGRGQQAQDARSPTPSSCEYVTSTPITETC